MKNSLNYRVFTATMANVVHCCHDWHPNFGCYRQINNYEFRPGGGDPVVGTRFEYPEFVVDSELTISVVNHAFVVKADRMYDYITVMKERANMRGITCWQDVEKTHADDHVIPDMVLGRIRKNMSFSSFVRGLIPQSDQHGTQTQCVCDAIKRVVGVNVSMLTMEHFTGRDLVQWYRKFDDPGPNWSHSCMTGGNASYTEIWGTAPKQLRLAVVSDCKGPIARSLIFNPSTQDAVNLGDPVVGPGWFYGRVYPMGENDCLPVIKTEKAISLMESMGLADVSSPACNNGGWVSLKLTDESPYIDRGHIMHNPNSDGALWIPDDSQHISRFQRTGYHIIDSCTDGSGFHSGEMSHCSCCEDDVDSEDITYVESYGDVCSGCLDNGSFHTVIGGDWRHEDDVIEIRSNNYSDIDEEYVATNCRSVYSNGSGERVRLTRVEGDNGSLLVPTNEVIVLWDGENIWKGLEQELAVVTTTVKIVNGLFHWSPISSDYEMFALKENTIPLHGCNTRAVITDKSGFIHWIAKQDAALCEPVPNPEYTNSIMIADKRHIACRWGAWFMITDSTTDRIVTHTTCWSDEAPNGPKIGQTCAHLPTNKYAGEFITLDHSVAIGIVNCRESIVDTKSVYPYVRPEHNGWHTTNNFDSSCNNVIQQMGQNKANGEGVYHYDHEDGTKSRHNCRFFMIIDNFILIANDSYEVRGIALAYSNARFCISESKACNIINASAPRICNAEGRERWIYLFRSIRDKVDPNLTYSSLSQEVLDRVQNHVGWHAVGSSNSQGVTV